MSTILTIRSFQTGKPVLIEEQTETADEAFSNPDGSWGSKLRAPAGPGWQVSDFNNDGAPRGNGGGHDATV